MGSRKLIQAAENGDVHYLLKDLNNNSTAIQEVALEGGETPLHKACFAGHVNFAQTVIQHSHEFCWEINQDGFTPLHIAAACGHSEIVKALLNVHHDLCLIKGKDSKIPLHMAVVKGKVQVVKELLWARSASVECTTSHHETSLHLAVNNNQFEALQVLIQHLKQFNKEDVLNCKDLYGNTILHLAASKKQYEVVKFLLNGEVTSIEKIELNAVNIRGLTPLDMLLMFQSEAGDREIAEILIQAGARKSETPQSPQQERPNNPDTRAEILHRRWPRNWSEFGHFFRYNPAGGDSPREVRNTLLVVAILIMTATYQIAVNPPGGVWQDDSSGSTTSDKHQSGRSIAGTNHPIQFLMLMFANSLGFFYSLMMILNLTRGFPMRLELQCALLGLICCYFNCVGSIIPKGDLKKIFTFMWFPIGIIVILGTQLLRYIWRKCIETSEEKELPYNFD